MIVEIQGRTDMGGSVYQFRGRWYCELLVVRQVYISVRGTPIQEMYIASNL